MNYEGFFPGALPAFIDTHAPGAFIANECSDAVYIHNPYSTRRTETPDAIAAMRKAGSIYGLELTVAETSPDVQGNIAMLQQTVGKQSLVVVRAGDGGLNKVLSAVRALGLQNPVKADAGGRKNDIVTQVLGRKYQENPQLALSRSVVRLLRPIELTLGRVDGSVLQADAFGYFSAGVTDEVAAVASSDSWRTEQAGKGPLGLFSAEAIMALGSLWRARQYTATLDDKKPRKVIDIIGSNGNTMAGDMHPRQQLFEPGFRFLTSRNRLTGAVILVATAVRLSVGRKIAPSSELALTIAGREQDRIQVDGDEIPGITQLRAKTAQTGVYMLADPSKA